jgi:hypothetical protein
LEKKVAEERGDDVLCTSISFVSPLPLLLAFFFFAIAAAAASKQGLICVEVERSAVAIYSIQISGVWC